jgi:hypothetical protein
VLGGYKAQKFGNRERFAEQEALHDLAIKTFQVI